MPCGPGLRPGVRWLLSDHSDARRMNPPGTDQLVLPLFTYVVSSCQGFPERELALALLVARVLADHHDSPVTANHLALLADLLDARLDLHGIPLRVLQFRLLVAVDNTTTCEVVRAQLHHYPVLREDSNIVLAHFS